MLVAARRSGLRLLALGASAAIAFAACSGNASTPTPAPTDTPAAPTEAITQAPSADTGTTEPTGTTCDLAAADTAFAKLTSYQFKMTLAGGAADVLQDLPIDQADVYTLKGTIVNSPAAAADITIGKFHLIEVDGFDYFDADGNGSFTQVGPDQGGGSGNGANATDTPAANATDTPTASAAPGSSLASQFTPEALFGGTVVGAADGFTLVGPEKKNGIDAQHCTAGTIALEQLGSTLGVADATWTADVWLATDGGYPVAVSLVAKAKNGSLPYEILLDLSKVNDSGNKVSAPTNISGA